MILFWNKVFRIIFSIALALSIFIISVKFTLNFRSLYYFDIEYLNIEEFSGLKEDEIKLNYNYLIDYMNDKDAAEFKLPTLPSSKYGQIHFVEVKNIFVTLDIILKISLSIILLGLIINYKNIYLLKHVSTILLVTPIVILIPFAINFDTTFTIFHKIFFRNDYWIFDPSEDPIINILPQGFFLHSALIILFKVLFICIILKIIFRKKPASLTRSYDLNL